MPPSKTLWRFSPPDADALAPALSALLAALCRAPSAHARFLNTLSLLEHVGSRKIMASQSPGPLPEDALRHLAEEARHAHFFRRAAERVAGRALSYEDEDLLAPAASRMYFGRLDAGIAALLPGPGRALAYPYVTFAVEVRAAWLYRLYQEALSRGGVPLSLAGVLAEEDAHLAAVDSELARRDPLYPERAGRVCALESALFARWLGAVESGVR